MVAERNMERKKNVKTALGFSVLSFIFLSSFFILFDGSLKIPFYLWIISFFLSFAVFLTFAKFPERVELFIFSFFISYGLGFLALIFKSVQFDISSLWISISSISCIIISATFAVTFGALMRAKSKKEETGEIERREEDKRIERREEDKRKEGDRTKDSMSTSEDSKVMLSGSEPMKNDVRNYIDDKHTMEYVSSRLNFFSEEIKIDILGEFEKFRDKINFISSTIDSELEKMRKISSSLSELHISLSVMKDRISGVSFLFGDFQENMELHIKNFISLVEKLVSQNFDLPNFSLETPYSKIYSQKPTELKDTLEKLGDELMRMEKKLSSSNLSLLKDSINEIKDIISSFRSSIHDFLRISYSFFMISLKTAQLISTTDDVTIRRVLSAIIQDIDSLSFKINVHIKDISDVFSSFENETAKFESYMYVILGKLSDIKNSFGRIKSLYENSVKKRVDPFFLRFSAFFDTTDLKELNNSTHKLQDELKKTRTEGEAIMKTMSDVFQITKDINSYVKKLSERIEIYKEKINELRRLVDEIYTELSQLRKQLPKISEYDFYSTRVIENYIRLFRDISGKHIGKGEEEKAEEHH